MGLGTEFQAVRDGRVQPGFLCVQAQAARPGALWPGGKAARRQGAAQEEGVDSDFDFLDQGNFLYSTYTGVPRTEPVTENGCVKSQLK